MGRASTLALFPGTFDPITNGHLDVIRRGQTLFSPLTVAVGLNPEKPQLFTMAERREIIQELVEDLGEDVRVDTYEGLTVDYARRIGATVILRGLRNVTDLNFEFQLALTNRAIADIETVFIMTAERYGFTSSTLIKQIASAGDIDALHLLLPPPVVERLRKLKAKSGGRIPWHTVDGFKE